MVKIQVTDKDIQVANEAREKWGFDICETCPISVAMKRQIPGFDWYTAIVCVYRHRDSEIAIPLPEEASSFINKWDCRYYVRPFEFDIDLD